MNLDDFADQTGIELPDGPYETVAGFLLSALGHLPQTGESADVADSRLTVTELDGRRISRVKVTEAGGGRTAPTTLAQISCPRPPAGTARAAGPWPFAGSVPPAAPHIPRSLC